MKIGILGLQGGYSKHNSILSSIGIEGIYIKYDYDLDNCCALIIPGGEATTLTKLIKRNNLYPTLLKFVKKKPVFGTCAGLIMLSKNVNDKRIKTLNCLDITVCRNGWGSQINSFSTKIDLRWNTDKQFEAIFIRAPKITKINNSIEILSSFKGEPVLVQKDNYLGATFHPELVNDVRIHEYFLNMIDEK